MSNRPGVFVRLEAEVLEELRVRAGDMDQQARIEAGPREHLGRAGGLALYIRRLIYEHLGRELPPQHGDKNPKRNERNKEKRSRRLAQMQGEPRAPSP